MYAIVQDLFLLFSTKDVKTKWCEIFRTKMIIFKRFRNEGQSYPLPSHYYLS